mgnify:CR=1 FL=1
MSSERTVYCTKLKKEASGLAYPPYPGDIGKRLFANISEEAWQLWLGQQTKLINEYRLNPLEVSARTFLETSMLKFLFNEDKT